MLRSRICNFIIAVVFVLALLPSTALAHGFGSRYELSLPRWMFVVGGAGVVVVSFVIVSVFAGTERGAFTYTSKYITATPLRLITASRVVTAARAVVVGLFSLGLLSGLFGPQDFNRNLLTNLIWVGWWVGYTFTVIFIGNTWPVLNPWKTIYEWVEALLGRDPTLERTYPFANIPLFLMFLGFAWIEIIAPVSQSPRLLTAIIIGYSLYLWFGMFIFGKEVWLNEADPFTRLYAYLGKFAPLSRDNGGEVRMYGVGLVPKETSLYNVGALAFLVAVLYSVTFDGFLATPEWRTTVFSVPQLPIPYATSTVLMFVGVGVFIIAYLAFAWLIKRAVGGHFGTVAIARRFALSLLPIAIVYQVSHFYTFLLIQSQFFVLALVDPFGLGWNPLGLGGFEPSAQLPLVSVQFVWQSQVTLIVIGHIIAVWVAHHIALEVFPDRWQAIKSQIPMMALMVLYTMLSLWILTRPVLDPPVP